MKKPDTVIITFSLDDADTILLILYERLLDLHDQEDLNSEEFKFLENNILNFIIKIANALKR